MLPTSPIQTLRTLEITADHEAQLQHFFVANPEYFMAVNGEPAGPNEAIAEIETLPPPGWGYSKRWLVGYANAQGELVALADVVADLLAPNVWHIGLFMVATARFGTGDAQALYRSLEAWAAASGAHWLRLGVVQGNQRAERFWEAAGFVQTKLRHGVQMGKRSNTLRVMFKPLAGGTLEQYLCLVERDRPEPK